MLQKRSKFPLLIALLLAPSGCGVNRAWLQRDVRKETLTPSPALNTEQSATMNGNSSDSGNCSLSCSVSSVEMEELGVLRGGELSRNSRTVSV